MATRPIGADSAYVITPHQFPPAGAALIAARILNKHSPSKIAEAVEILIDVLDLVGGDPDLEEDNEDRCMAGDDAYDGYSDGRPGDSSDAEEDNEDCCEAGDDGCGYFVLGSRSGWGYERDEG